MRQIKIVGMIFTTLQLILATCFLIYIGMSGILPVRIFLLIILGFAILQGISTLLVLKSRRKIILILGIFVPILSVIATGIAYYYISPAIRILQKISEDYDELATVSAYVRMDDMAQSLYDAKEYDFGILTALDRENTDQAVEQMQGKLNATLNICEYTNVTELADALSKNDVQVIVLNQSFLQVLDEIDGYEQFSKQIREINCETVTLPQTDTEKTKKDILKSDVFTFYISGVDGWGGIDNVGRSDVNIIATVNTETRQILLVSTPRDYFVEIPISNGIKDKLTHAGIYGIDCSVGTLEDFYGIDIDYYFRINFSGFEAIIDAIGGVDVYSDYDFTVSDWHYQVGMNHLDGLSALAFARERYSLPGGDLARGRNQMRIIQATLNKCMSPAILTHYTEVMSEIEGTFQTDMSYEMIAELVRMQIEDSTAWNIQSYSVSGTGMHSGTYSIPNMSLYVMEPDMTTVEQAKDLMQRIRNGEVVNVTE